MSKLLNYTVLDVETSGLLPQNDQIIEFAMVRVRNGEPVLVFNTLVNFQDELNPKITELTGHTIQDLEGGITENQLAWAVNALITRDELLIAYNASFDLSFLEVLLMKHVYDEDFRLGNNFIDPLTIARDRHPYPHKQVNICAKYGITYDAHSAYEDAFALLDLVQAFDAEKPVGEYVNVLGYMRKYGPPDWVPSHAVTKPQGHETVVRNKRASAPIVPKSHGAVVTTNSNRKKRTPPKVDESTLPTALVLHPSIVEELDDFIEGIRDVVTVSVEPYEGTDVSEFNLAWEYLLQKGVPDHVLTSWLDNPSEAVIERNYKRQVDYDPFARGGGPIEISDDDLPF